MNATVYTDTYLELATNNAPSKLANVCTLPAYRVIASGLFIIVSNLTSVCESYEQYRSARVKTPPVVCDSRVIQTVPRMLGTSRHLEPAKLACHKLEKGGQGEETWAKKGLTRYTQTTTRLDSSIRPSAQTPVARDSVSLRSTRGNWPHYEHTNTNKYRLYQRYVPFSESARPWTNVFLSYSPFSCSPKWCIITELCPLTHTRLLIPVTLATLCMDTRLASRSRQLSVVHAPTSTRLHILTSPMYTVHTLYPIEIHFLHSTGSKSSNPAENGAPRRHLSFPHPVPPKRHAAVPNSAIHITLVFTVPFPNGTTKVLSSPKNRCRRLHVTMPKHPSFPSHISPASV